MMKLELVKINQSSLAMDIIDMAKAHLKQQGIDQWQTGYPDLECIQKDISNKKGFFIVDDESILGYLCIDFDGEAAYEKLNGTWINDEKYVVVHRMAFSDKARGKGISNKVFKLVEEYSKNKGVSTFKIDTDADNKKMKHILENNGFTFRGTICFDNSEKIAFDKIIK